MKPGGALSVLKDKRVMVGAAVAGGLGLVVLLRRGGSPVDQPAGAVLSPAQVDSSGTDLYNALQQFNDGLSDIRDLLEQQPATGTGSDPAKGTPKPPPIYTTDPPKRTPPVVRPAPKPAPKPAGKLYARVTRWGGSGPKWTQTLSGIAGHYHTSVSTLMKLNPGIKDADLVYAGQKIRYK